MRAPVTFDAFATYRRLNALPPARTLARQRLRDLARRMPERFLWWEGEPYPILAGAAANTQPLFLLTPQVGFATVTAANTATDGTGTVLPIFTAAANGSRLDRVRCVALGTNIATKAYFFVNNGGSQAVAANNALLLDLPLASGTASNTALISAPVEIVFALPLKSGYIINVTLATAVATGWTFIGIGGDW